jgi:signal transduction histidine kinase
MGLEYTILITSVSACLFIGLFVLVQKASSNTNRLLFLFTIASAFLSIANFYSLHQETGAQTLHVVRLELLCASFYSFLLFLTIHTFPSKKIRLQKPYLLLSVSTTLILGGLTQTPLIIKSIEGTGLNSVTTPGILIGFFALLNGFYIISAIYILTQRYRSSTGALKAQLQYLLLGVISSSLLIFITDFVFVVILRISLFLSLLPLFTLIFVFSTTYAIVTHHLFDIRVIIKRTVMYSGLILSTLGIYSLVVFILTGLFQGNNAFSTRTFLTNVFAAGLIAFTSEPIRRYLGKVTDRVFFKGEYEQQAVLKGLAEKLNDVIALDEALEIVMQTIVKVLHLRHAAVLIFQPGENGVTAIKRIKQIGYSATSHLFISEQDFIIQYFSTHPEIAEFDILQNDLEKEKYHMNTLARSSSKAAGEDVSSLIRQHAVKSSVVKKLKALEVSVVIPLHLSQQPIGLILLSDKLSGDTFFPNDLNLLDTIGAQAISSIQKAKLYEGDQMKSEFVSIASHELLTPISAIEGYLSMILEENIGKVDEQARDYLGKVYTSAKRLSLLIKDLLSVSRIEAGRLNINTQSLDITKMINDTVDQLKFIAQEKALVMKVELPATPLPPVWADPDRTIQVLVNLVSNAIKYTPTGTVRITATLVHHPSPCVKVSVIDTGLGMSKEQQSHLFEKFYRVDSPDTTGIIGTGLGLYITKSILERMGGSIAIQSTLGQGTTFSFTLPLFKVESSTM